MTGPSWEAQQPWQASDVLGDLVLITAPTYSILTPEEMMRYLRIDSDDNTEYELIVDLIEMATDYCEKAISGHRQFRTAVYDLPIRGWWGGELSMPRHPLQSVGSIKYYDSAGVLQTAANSLYTVHASWRAPGIIAMAPNQDWPDHQDDREFPILIRFTTGYLPGKCPPTVKQAIRLLVAQAYWQRCPVEEALNNTVRNLLDLEGCRYK